MDSGLSIAARGFYAPPVQEIPHDVDAELARRIAAGDPEAEAPFCRRFAPRIRLFGLKRLRNEAAAADLVQDVLIVALQKLRAGAVREPERIASFMLGMARQMMLDSMRNSGRRERILDEFPIDLIPVEEPAAEEPDEARLQHCLQALPERERTRARHDFLRRLSGRRAGHAARPVDRQCARDSPSRPATPA